MGKRRTLVLLLIPFAAAGCRGDRPSPREPDSLTPNRPAVHAQRYADEALSLEVPAGWTVSAVPGQDPNVHAVNLTGPAGAYARVTLIRESPTPSSFPGEVLESLRRATPGLAGEPYETQLARRAAKGFRYRFEKAGTDWVGWVVSYVQDRGEVCALGQFPAKSRDLEEEFKTVLRTLRVKEEGGVP
jgi:hypothetical protein